MKTWKKITLLSTAMFLVLLSVIFFRPVVCSVIESEISRSIENPTPIKVRFKSIGYKKGSFYLKRIKISSGNNLARIEKAVLSKAKNSKGRFWEVKLISPEIQLSCVEQSKRGQGLYRSIDKVLTGMHLNVEDGKCFFSNRDDPVFFSFLPSREKEKLGTFQLGFSPGVFPMQVEFFKSFKEILAKVNFQGFDLSQLEKSFPLWDGERLKGALDGELEVGVTHKDLLRYFNTDITLKKFTFLGAGGLKDIACKYASLKAYLPIDKKPQLSLKELSKLHFVQSLITSLTVDGLDVDLHNPTTSSVWSLNALSGTAGFHQHQITSVNLQGSLQQENTLFPFNLSGRGSLDDEKKWWCDFDLAIFSNGEREPTHTGIYLALLDEETLFAKTSLSSLGVVPVKMAQDLLLMAFPSMPKFEIEDVLLDTAVTMEYSKNKHLNLNFKNIDISSLAVSEKQSGYRLSCGKTKGKMHLVFPLFKGYDPIFCDIDFGDLDVTMPFQGETKTFSQGEGKLHIKDKHFVDTHLSGFFDGVYTEVEFDGVYRDFQAKAYFDFTEKHLLSSLQDKVLSVTQGVKPLDKAILEIQCKLIDKLLLKGELHLRHQNKNEKDSISFGVELEKREWFGEYIDRDLLLSSSPTGWFHTDSLSHHSYLWLLALTPIDWFVTGDISATGEFSSSALVFSLETSSAVYEADEITVSVCSDSDDKYKGIFSFEIGSKSWDVSIPLHDAKAYSKDFGLDFDKVSGTLQIHGDDLFAENLSAKCHEIDFSGRIHFNFEDKDWLELKILPENISGSVQNFVSFMHHFPEFEKLQLPLEGRIVSCGENALFVRYNKTDSFARSKYSLAVKEGSSQLSSQCNFDDISCLLLWDSESDILDIRDVSGKVALGSSNEKVFDLNAQYITLKDPEKFLWEYDLRLEAPTFDILRLVGTTEKLDELISINLDKSLSHFYNVKLDESQLIFHDDFSLAALQLKSKILVSDLLYQLDCFALSGMFDRESFGISDLIGSKVEGEIAFSLDYEKDLDVFDFALFSRGILIDRVFLEDLDLTCKISSDKVCLESFKSKKFAGNFSMSRSEDQWVFDYAYARYGASSFSAKSGCLDLKAQKISFSADTIEVGTDGLVKVFPSLSPFVQGVMSFAGLVELDFTKGLKQADIFANLKLNSSEIVGVSVCSKDYIHCHLQGFSELYVTDSFFTFAIDKEKELVTSIDIGKAFFDFKTSKIEGQRIKWLLPPEMLFEIASKEMVASKNLLPIEGDKIQLCGAEFSWDNQIETIFDFSASPQSIALHGQLKEGYYWIGEKSFYFKDFLYSYHTGMLHLDFCFDHEDVSLALSSNIDLTEKSATIYLVDGKDEEAFKSKPLEISIKSHKNDGVCIQSVVGELYGLDFAFHRNPKTYVPHVMILTGSVKIDTAGLVKTFPKFFYQAIKDLGMGSGYVLSGDLVLSKKDIKTSNFKGFLKGRDFEFLGFHFKTLLSSLEVSAKQVYVYDFRLSDMSGVTQIKEVKVVKNQETDKWEMNIPEITVQDFRPSFLKKSQGDTEEEKPFVINDLHFFNIQGELDDKSTFTGRGYLDFINTYKRDYSLLDIPIEIIGRIGFDLGLFVPVKGKLDFEMIDGRIFFRDLKHSYSEGKRSKFYLSGYKDSYIDLDGNIFIDIKMKQYVLLKITEPFTISIRGTLEKPKYNLR